MSIISQLLEDIKGLLGGSSGGGATAGGQDTGNASLAAIDAKLAAPLTVNVGLTDAELRLTPIAVSVSGAATSVKQDELLNTINDGIVSYDPVLKTYVATFKVAGRPYSLSHSFAANTRKQYATIFHNALSTKTVKLRRVELIIRDSSGTAMVLADVVRITSAPVSGNPVITPSANLSNSPAAEAVCLALPITGGKETAQFGALEIELGNTGGAPTINPPPLPPVITLYADTAHEGEPLTLRAGVAEGFAVVLDSNAAVAIFAIVRMVFTEE